MASSLEIGKLVAASVLYRNWENLNALLRTYLSIAVLVLMGITSLGIFGFLSDAYVRAKEKSMNATLVEESLVQKKSQLLQEADFTRERLKTLNDTRVIAQKNFSVKSNTDDKTTKYYEYRNTQAIMKDLDKVGAEIPELQKKMDATFTEITAINNEIIAAKEKASKESDIGTFKFVAKLFNTDLDTVVKWFIIVIVSVFDPLAVCLLTAYNALVKKK
jgi:hypothetical protein